MSIVTDFTSIHRKLNRLEQKAEWDRVNDRLLQALASEFGTMSQAQYDAAHADSVFGYIAPENDPA